MEQKRFILAMVLSAAVLLIWQAFVAPPVPEEGQETQQTAEQEVDADKADDSAGTEAGDDEQALADKQPSDDEPTAADDEQAERAEAAEAEPEPRNVAVRRDVLKTDRLTVGLTNKEARVVSAELTEPEQYIARGDLVGFPDDAEHYPFKTHFIEQNFDFPEAPVYEVVEQKSVKREDGTYSKLFYRYDDPRGRFAIDKVFTVDEDLPYVVDMDLTVHNNLSDARLVDTMAVDIFEWKDPNKETSFLDFQPNVVEGICHNTEDIERETFDSVQDTPQRFDEGETLWGAVDTRYFMMAAIPADPAVRCELKVVDTNYLRTRIVHDGFSLAPDSSKTLSHKLFLGPKDVDVLDEIGDAIQGDSGVKLRLAESVDYGMFAFIAKPLRWGLEKLYNIAGNWGVAIILLTIIIRGLVWPINIKAYSSMERMKKVQPMLKEVREKYEDDKQRMTEETMKLFREHNVSPAGGCLPMLLQMPILYGLYVMIYNSVELYHADFALWYTNLAEPDPYYVLPILMGVVMFAQQQMSTVDQSNKQAAIMMKVMPVMFTAFMFFLPSGLVLYYALSLLIGVGQQYYVKKKFSGEEIEPAKS